MNARQPSNLDLLQEIKQVQATQLDHGNRLNALETWRVAEAAARSAVDEYKKEAERSRYANDKRKLVRDVASFLAVLTILVWAIVENLARNH